MAKPSRSVQHWVLVWSGRKLRKMTQYCITGHELVLRPEQARLARKQKNNFWLNLNKTDQK
jgi:hypothetical protein